ncbi:carbohydrate-binding protein [Pontiellaceae bacterium B1224]|nr:carbohydrate-binding protein [Pontiellaceae bacterium B1224]
MTKQLKQKIVLGMCSAFTLSTVAGNPILKETDPAFLYAADSAAEVFDGKVYVYCSHDQPDAKGYSSMQDYMILESSDMTNWINHGVVLRPRTDAGFEYADGQMNAPDCAYKDGWYYWYFPYNKTYVGVAKSESPIGPWESAVSTNMAVIFDPTVFVDDDGQAYIYGNDLKVRFKKGPTYIYGAKLKDNMIELDGPWHRLAAENVSEAVTVFKRDGVYYFMARRGWDETAYWMADNPLPYPENPERPKNPIHNDPETGYASYKGLITGKENHAVNAPAHMSAIEFKDDWYFFYHRGDVNSGSGNRRSACVDRMYFNEDGTIKPIVYTLDEGMNDASSENPRGVGTSHLEAEGFKNQSGIKVEGCRDIGDGKQLGFINNGDWVSYAKVDFGNESRKGIPLYVRASSKNKGGTIEFRLNSETGPVVGTVAVKGTGGWETYETVDGTLSGVSGVQDLYLTFSGGEGNLLNLNWIEWTPASGK